jgi:hypothetical protein
VQNIAETKLAEFTNRNPQATIESHGLETIKPGDNIWLIIPRQQISGQYKIIQINQLFGMKTGGWRTKCVMEEEETGIARTIQRVNSKTDAISNTENANKLNYSYNFPFDSDSGIHAGTQITSGVLKTDGGASGTWISPTRNITENAEQYELRVAGESIPGTLFYVSSDGGNTWQDIVAQKTLYDMSPPGQNIKIKVVFASASTQIKSLALLYL